MSFLIHSLWTKIGDQVVLFQKYVLRDEAVRRQRPPWDMEAAKPEYYASYQQAQQMKIEGVKNRKSVNIVENSQDTVQKLHQ